MSKRNRRKTHNGQVQPHGGIVINCAVPSYGGIQEGTSDTVRKMVITVIDSDKLEVDYGYQRPTRPEKVQEIVDQFDPALVNVLKVSYRDSRNWIFDGAHTLAALKKIHKNESFPVVCQVFYGLTFEEEALLFSKQHGCETKVPNSYQLRAREKAEDEKTLDFLERTHNAGFEITLGSSRVRDGYITAVKRAFDAYEQMGPEAYEEMLRLIKDTWNGEAWSVSKTMISGVKAFYQAYSDQFRLTRFSGKLRQVTKEMLDREASKYYSLPSALAHALAIGKFYNKAGGYGTVDLTKLTIKDVQTGGES